MRCITVRRTLVPAVVAVGLALCPSSASAADSLTPSAVELTLAPGQSATVSKTLHLDAAPPQADIEIAIDTTGSMIDSIAQAKADATDLVNQIQSSIPDARFAVVDFKDSGDGADEYRLLQPMTGSASAVQSAINTMSPVGGGDHPEAHNLVFNKSYSDAAIGFRATARKFVVVLSDAQPHGAADAGLAGCTDRSPDPHGLVTTTELANMNAAELTLFMVRQIPTSTASLQCYQSIAALAFTGGVGVNSGTALGAQIVALINSASQSINQVVLSVTPAAFASWVSFAPASPYGPVTAPFDKDFTETITVPAATPDGDYAFDVVLSADGAQRATEHVLVHVVSPPKVSVSDVTVTEGNTGLSPATPATFAVTLNKPSAQTVTVHYKTLDGSATAPADYQALPDTVLTFAAGQTSKLVTANVVGDLADEPNETFHLMLSSPTMATIADDDGLGTILDDDRSGGFACRGAGLRLLGAELAVSNAPYTPCKDASASVLNVPLPLLGTIRVGANVVNSSTNQTPDDLVNTSPAVGDRAEADSHVAVVTLLAGLTTVKADVVDSHAEARCGSPLGGAPALTGSSVLTNVTVNGSPVVVADAEVTINVALGVIHLNSTTTTATGVTQRGIWFENKVLSSSLDVVVAEARAGFNGNPCM